MIMVITIDDSADAMPWRQGENGSIGGALFCCVADDPDFCVPICL